MIKVSFTRVVKSVILKPVNENDDINTLTDSLNDLTVSESVYREIINPNVLNNIPRKSTSMSYLIIQIIIIEIEPWKKVKGSINSWFNVKDIIQDEHISVELSKIKGWKNIEEKVLITTPSDKNVEILEANQTGLNSSVKNKDWKVVSVRWIIS